MVRCMLSIEWMGMLQLEEAMAIANPPCYAERRRRLLMEWSLHMWLMPFTCLGIQTMTMGQILQTLVESKAK